MHFRLVNLGYCTPLEIGVKRDGLEFVGAKFCGGVSSGTRR